MKVISFNANGLRARIHQIKAIIDKHKPDVIGIQEIKVCNEQFPIKEIKELGYDAIFHGQKGHYGVALLYRLPLIDSQKGFPHDSDESQKRLITGRFQFSDKKITVLNGYFPQGESRAHDLKYPYKRKFYSDLAEHLDQKHNPNDLLLVIGDMNIAPTDLDIGIAKESKQRWLRTGKCCFLPEEREWLQKIEKWGLTDAYRHFYPKETNRLSWFDYRSRGFEMNPKRGLRIDLILASKPAIEITTDAGIDHAIRGMEKPSDHCPIWITLDN
jgi:exodeoxyribonuclease-3